MFHFARAPTMSICTITISTQKYLLKQFEYETVTDLQFSLFLFLFVCILLLWRSDCKQCQTIMQIFDARQIKFTLNPNKMVYIHDAYIYSDSNKDQMTTAVSCAIINADPKHSPNLYAIGKKFLCFSSFISSLR